MYKTKHKIVTAFLALLVITVFFGCEDKTKSNQENITLDVIENNYRLLDLHFKEENNEDTKEYLHEKTKKLFSEIRENLNSKSVIQPLINKVDSIIKNELFYLKDGVSINESNSLFSEFKSTYKLKDLDKTEFVITNCLVEYNLINERINFRNFQSVNVKKEYVSDTNQYFIFLALDKTDFVKCFTGTLDTNTWNIQDGSKEILFDSTSKSFLYKTNQTEFNSKWGDAFIKIDREYGIKYLPVFLNK